MVAQVWQAAGSFGLQLLAAWLLGASGLGLLSLCLGIIILATAVASGMVGDSLVILDRHDPRIRGGLQVWTLLLAGFSFVAVFVAVTTSGLLSPADGLLVALALVAFQLEELVRRVLMATMHFWRLVIVDSAAVLTALGVVGVWVLVAEVGLDTFLLGLLVGQVVGALTGLALLPRAERYLVRLRGAAVARVAGFGAWRGLQVAVAPSVLTAMRVVVTAVAGAAALGEIELARLYAAPALLAVQGLGSYLLSTYVRDKQLPLVRLRSRAWRASLALVGAALVVGALLTFFAPGLADAVSGPHVAVDQLAVAGWVLYVAASASLQPFASLAAARGRPARVLACRCIDAGLVVVLLVVLLSSGMPTGWTPFVLAGGLLLGGVLVRQLVLRPLVKAEKLADEAAVREVSAATA